MAVISIQGKLTDGTNEIDLHVHRFYVEQSSPCVVRENQTSCGLIGGTIESIEEIFQLQIAKHPGYVLQPASIVAIAA
jgi:hypothetical protein